MYKFWQISCSQRKNVQSIYMTEGTVQDPAFSCEQLSSSSNEDVYEPFLIPEPPCEE